MGNVLICWLCVWIAHEQMNDDSISFCCCCCFEDEDEDDWFHIYFAASLQIEWTNETQRRIRQWLNGNANTEKKEKKTKSAGKIQTSIEQKANALCHVKPMHRDQLNSKSYWSEWIISHTSNSPGSTKTIPWVCRYAESVRASNDDDFSIMFHTFVHAMNGTVTRPMHSCKWYDALMTWANKRWICNTDKKSIVEFGSRGYLFSVLIWKKKPTITMMMTMKMIQCVDIKLCIFHF